MKQIRRTSRFKKDLKRYQNKKSTLEALYRIVSMLANGESLPKEIRPNMLSGNYKGFMECHVENDSLLIWIEVSESGEETIVLSRFGSHSELF